MLLHTADALLCQPLVPWNELKVGSRFPPIHLFLISARMLSCMSFCSCWISLSRSLLSASIPPCKCTMHMIMAYQQIPTRWEYVMMIMGGNDHLEMSTSVTSPPSKHWWQLCLLVVSVENQGMLALGSWRSYYGGTLLLNIITKTHWDPLGSFYLPVVRCMWLLDMFSTCSSGIEANISSTLEKVWF